MNRPFTMILLVVCALAAVSLARPPGFLPPPLPPPPPIPTVCWTKWYDRDNPSGTGDWEPLSDLRNENPGEICANPIAIESKTVDTNTPAATTGQHFLHFSPTIGFVCKNGPNQCCRDYKVRFGCSWVGSCPRVWIGRDVRDGPNAEAIP